MRASPQARRRCETRAEKELAGGGGGEKENSCAPAKAEPYQQIHTPLGCVTACPGGGPRGATILPDVGMARRPSLQAGRGTPANGGWQGCGKGGQAALRTLTAKRQAVGPLTADSGAASEAQDLARPTHATHPHTGHELWLVFFSANTAHDSPGRRRARAQQRPVKTPPWRF